MPAPASTHSPARPEQKQQVGGRQWRRWLFALLLVAALVFAALHWGDVEEFAELLGKARPIWLLGALALQLLTYLSLSAEWWLVLKRGGSPLPLRALFPITITKLFADQVVPTAGVSGNVLLVDRLKARGVPRHNAVAAVILAILAYYASFAIVALAAVEVLWLRSEIGWPLIIVVSIFFVVAAAIPAGALWLQRKGQEAVPAWLERWSGPKELLEMFGEAPKQLVRDPRLIGQLALLNAAVFLLDAATMMLCLLALGGVAPFDAAFVALVIASIVVTIGPIPLGLGSFEAASIGTLRLMGIPFEAALSATLLYRGFALWLPLIGGLILSRRELHRH
jgi:glycosyltransferase 2 family protein